MFQLEILSAKIVDMGLLEKLGVYEEGAGDDVVTYIVYCRIAVGDLPIGSMPVVWVYGAGRPSVKASLSYAWVHYDFERMSYDAWVRVRDSFTREGYYALEAPPGAEIAAGMLISDVPPDAV